MFEGNYDIIVEITTDFLRSIDFWGMAAFEFKVDQATGRRVLLDPNFGRLALTGPAADANGVPLLYSQYCEVSGRISVLMISLAG